MALPSTIIKRGVRADQPAVADTAAGTLYCVTDEANLVERCDGADWLPFGVASGLTLLDSQTASASASLVFTDVITSDYDIYQVEFINIVPSTDASLHMHVSTNAGSSYDTAANYVNATLQINQGTFVGALNGGTTDTEILICNSVEATSNSLSGHIKIYAPLSASHYKIIQGQNTTMKSDGNFYQTMVSGRYTSATAVNAFRFQFASGNIASGTIRVYGVIQ
jgi:hypothetical protein